MPNLTNISHNELKARLRVGAQRFYFRKVTGELRIALGVTNLEMIPGSAQPVGGAAKKKSTPYYDLEKGAWRSISESQEVWID